MNIDDIHVSLQSLVESRKESEVGITVAVIFGTDTIELDSDVDVTDLRCGGARTRAEQQRKRDGMAVENGPDLFESVFVHRQVRALSHSSRYAAFCNSITQAVDSENYSPSFVKQAVSDALEALPPRPLTVSDYEALEAADAPITPFPVSWYDDEVIYSLVLFVGRDSEPVVTAFDEPAQQWEVVDRPDPEQGFDELDDLLRPWFEETYGEIPDELAVAPPDYDLDSRN